MRFVPRDASDQQILDVGRYWIEVLAREDYAGVFDALGYLLLPYYDLPGPEVIRGMIKKYRSPEIYPGVEDFVVTSWRTATGGNPSPLQHITRYEPSQGLGGALSIHLPLNGRWSDLQADFVWFENENLNEGYTLRLEEIGSLAQRQREYEGAP